MQLEPTNTGWIEVISSGFMFSGRTEEHVLVGAQDYEARCRSCFRPGSLAGSEDDDG